MPSPTPWTLKRLAWAFGCAGKGSSEESSLREELTRRIREEETERIVTHLRLRGRQLIDAVPTPLGGRVEAGIHRGQALMDEAARIEAGGRLHTEAPATPGEKPYSTRPNGTHDVCNECGSEWGAHAPEWHEKDCPHHNAEAV